MSTQASGPTTHTHVRIRPMAYRTTVADPPRFPKLVRLRCSAGHTLGVGYVWRRQGYVTWRSARQG